MSYVPEEDAPRKVESLETLDGRTNQPRRRTAIAALFVLVLTTTACDQTASFEDLPEIVISASDYSFDAPRSAEGGLVRLTLDNDGAEAHQVELVRVAEGREASEIGAAIRRGDVVALNSMVTYHGGPNEVPPGSRRSVATQLDPGTYVLLCFVASPDGTLHVLRGMIGELEITQPDSPAPARPPTFDASVSLQDYRFEVTGDIGEGRQLVLVKNEGSEPHELRLFSGDIGAGGSSTISPGGETWVELDLESGTQSVFCYVPSEEQSGLLHSDLGMRTSINVP